MPPLRKTRRPLLLSPTAVSAILLTTLFLTSGCSGGPAITEQQIARQQLPVPRTVPPPDSLVHVRLVKKEGKTRFNLDRSLGRIEILWSSSYQRVRGRTSFYRAGTYQTFATFRSLELRLARLAREMDVESLTPETSQSIIRRERGRYQEFVTFDVHVFVSAASAESFLNADLRSLNPRIALRDGQGNTYDPARIEVPGKAQRTRHTANDAGAYHQTNTIYFKRMVDGRDLLQNADRLELAIETSRPSAASILFEWQFDSEL